MLTQQNSLILFEKVVVMLWMARAPPLGRKVVPPTFSFRIIQVRAATGVPVMDLISEKYKNVFSTVNSKQIARISRVHIS